MRLGARGPVEHDIGRRHQFDLHDPSVDGMLAGIKRSHPNTLVAGIDEIAVLKLKTADIHVRLADKRDHDANVANRDL